MANGVTVWLTGLSGAGKTTLAERLLPELENRGHRVETLDALGRFTVSDRLDLERVEFAERGDLVEAERGVVDEPDRGRLRHEKLLGHE